MLGPLRARLRRLAGAPLCEVHVPIAPTPVFLLRVRLLAASLARYSGLDCRLVVTVSRDVEPYDLHAAEPWSRLSGVEWRWMSRSDYAELGMWGTAMKRFTYDFERPFVLMLDADTLCTGSLAELPALAADGIAGVMAWVTPMHDPPPFRDGRTRTAEQLWNDLHAHAGLPAPSLDHEHPGWRIMPGAPDDHRRAPAYFNLGMLAGSAAAMRTVGARVLPDLHVVDTFVDTRFRCQLGLTLSAAHCGVPLVPLPLRFNFPNSPWFWDDHPDDRDVRLLHYANTEEIDREQLRELADLEAITRRDDLTPPNTLFAERIGSLLSTLREGDR